MVERVQAAEERLLTGYAGRLFVILTVAFFVITMGSRLFPPLLPAIVEDLGITSFRAGVALSVFTVVRAAGQYPGGRYADKLSRKTVLLSSFALAVVGFATLSATVTYPMLLVGAAVVGAAAGLFVPANRALLSDLYRDKRGWAFGLNMSASDVTGIVAAGVAIVVVEYASWQAAFLLIVPAVGAVLVAFGRTSREPVELAWTDFGLRETVGRLFGTHQFRLIVSAYALRSIATNSVTYFLPLFLIATQGFSFEVASAAYALRYAVGIVVKPGAGLLADLLSRPGIAVASLVVTGLGIGVLVLAPTGLIAVAGIVVYAVGQKSFSAPMEAYLMDSFPDDSMGGDLGATRATFMGVGSLGPAVVGYLATAASFRLAFAAAGVLVGAALAVILVLERSD